MVSIVPHYYDQHKHIYVLYEENDTLYFTVNLLNCLCVNKSVKKKRLRNIS